MSAPGHVVERQDEVIAFLADPRTHGGAEVTRIDTHGAIVVLARDRAYKLKRAVRFPYMDFSTLELRRRAAEAELIVNRRTAPALYLAVEPVTRTAPGVLAIGGTGTVVDWLVVMRRFDQESLFDRMAAKGALDKRLMSELADAVLRFHADAEPRPDHGGAAGIARVVAGNDQGLAEAGPAAFSQDKVAALRRQSEAMLARRAALLEGRRMRGLARRCHGDLHLGNICLFEGRPTLFDAIEFNEEIACIDVLYDLAFLLMDLDHRKLGDLANLVFNRYLSEGARDGALGDLAGLAALPLFLACRAGVRAQVSAAAAAAQPEQGAAWRLIGAAAGYLDLALRYLAPPPARLVAIGGLSGTGKSTLARALAPHLGAAPGALVLRSDVIRKHLAGRGALSRLGPESYTREASARVFETIRARAATALAAGHAVIADAVYGRPEQRAAIESVARELRVSFDGFWLEAPAAVLAARVAARAGDASDATPEVLRRQLVSPLGEIVWTRLDAADEPGTVAWRARHLLGVGPARAE